jgi:hypothetical protein
MKNNLPLYLICVGIFVIILQNAGIITPLKTSTVNVSKIQSSVRVVGDVDVTGNVGIVGDVDANLNSIAGYGLVTSARGMFIGVNSISNTIIPINWGQISITP